MLILVMQLIINGMTFNNIKNEQIDYICNNYQMKLSDLEKETGLCDETIYRVLEAKGIKRERLYKIYLPKTEEVESLLKNPYLSHVQIAKKFNVTESCVALRRKSMGLSVRRGTSKTLPEIEISEILDSKDIAYTEQKRISKWSFDFNLGNMSLLDIHGLWSHSKDIQIVRDVDKTKFCIQNNYSYCVLFQDTPNKASFIESYYWASLYSNIQKNNWENCWNPKLLFGSKAISSRAIQGWMEGSETNHIPLDTVMQWTRVPSPFMYIKGEDIVRLLPKGKERN
jgi:hypothetical protein